jgi:hypothetical protein
MKSMGHLCTAAAANAEFLVLLDVGCKNLPVTVTPMQRASR